MMIINEFRGKYFFLSNLYEAPVMFEGLRFTNNEAAFQSAKLLDKQNRMIYCMLNPSESKKLGCKLRLRSDWEKIKDSVMESIVRDKFTRNKELGKKLIETNDVLLVEGNTWSDTCWGVCNGKGENRLGLILMKIRAELQEKENFDIAKNSILENHCERVLSRIM